MTLRPRQPRTTAALALLLVGLLTGLLSGCSGAGRPDTAAVVGGKAISSADLRIATQQLSENIDPQVNESVTLNLLILNELATEPAVASGTWRPDASYSAMVARVSQPAQATLAALSGFHANRALESAGLGAQVKERARTLGVTVNPRYGTFDVDAAQLGSTLPNWIRASSPAGRP